ncbi:hypothetical protein [Haloarchaeobius litoreus]|uniref:Uncharacterized protein n=1 Tax=Haloarchaeobius litoreus TaxID=755306 RepID=A0ABD6DJ49_9EURY|nr:hypothetical protein [Haloarchaeobius litoreus]
MGSPEDLVSHHITVLRRCGLSDEDICEVYGVSDPPDDVSVGRVVLESIDGEPTPRNLYDQTHRVLATAPRGIDAPRDYPNRVVPQQLNTVMGAFGFSMYFLDGNGEPLESGAEPSQPFRIALEDPNGNVRTTTFEYPDTGLGEQNYPALVAAIQSDMLDGVPLTFAMLSDWAEERWRFVLFETDRLDALEEHYGGGIECFGEPLLHEHTPAEFASGQAVSEPAVEAAAGSDASGGSGASDAGDDSDGDIGVDESTEGWLGSGGSDLSDVDLESSSDDVTADIEGTEERSEVETGLEDIFSTIEEDATAGGDGGVEIESTGKTVEDLVGGATGAADEEPAEAEPAPTADSEPEPAADPQPAADAATAETEPDPTPAEPGPADADASGASEAEPAAEPEPATAAAEPAEPESASLDADDDGGFVMADPEPARTEPETASEPAETAEPAAETTAEPASTVAESEPSGTEPEPEAPAEPSEPATESAPADPAEPEPEPADSTSPEATTAEEPASPPAGTDGSATASEESATANGPTASAEEPAATSEPAAAAEEGTVETNADDAAAAETSTDDAPAAETSTDDAAAAETSDDSPGVVGRIVAVIKGIF